MKVEDKSPGDNLQPTLLAHENYEDRVPQDNFLS